jgi:hypothetical protein
MRIPNFKKYKPEIIEEYADAFKKVSMGYKSLLNSDPGNPPNVGRW